MLPGCLLARLLARLLGRLPSACDESDAFRE
jgi:hypothetical protein